jgi:VanZ family protein
MDRESKCGSKQMSWFLMRMGWCLAMVAVTVLALLPIEYLELPVFNWWDKAQHALAFAVLSGWALLLWPRFALRVVLGMLVYGACIELAQWAVGWRFAEWADLAADAVGVFMAWLMLGWPSRRFLHRACACRDSTIR